jgi:hypothetical protein
VIYTEPGGRMEADLARYVTETESRLPIVAFMAGKFMDEMPGMSFGHAGTIVGARPTRRPRRSSASTRPALRSPRRLPRSPTSSGSDCGRPFRRERAIRANRAVHRSRVDDAVANDTELASKLAEVCPVDIFAQDSNGSSRSWSRISTSACSATSATDAAPQGTVRVKKLYE